MALTLGQLPTLRPGRAVLRRDARTLQIGIGPRPVRLPDTAAVGVLLRALDPRLPDAADEVDATDPDVRRALDRLEAAGHLLVDAEPAPPAYVRVIAADRELEDRVLPLLDAAGLVGRDEPSEVTLIVSAGPVSRDITDRLLQAGCAHLVAASVEGAWRIGPFVVPGRTACQRCVDAHESTADPRRALMLEQAARAARDAPEPTDPVTTPLALAWAVHDVRSYLAGGEPGTWSTTVDLPVGAPTSTPVITRWLRHAECGCAWDMLLELP